jgi:RNA polymerase sigma factor (sigma-70 family)
MSKKCLDKQQQDLIKDNYNLLRSFVLKQLNKKIILPVLEDDFISDINLKFCTSALKYNNSYGVKFSTYAYGGFNFGLRNIIQDKKDREFNQAYLLSGSIDYVKHYISLRRKRSLKENSMGDLFDKSNLTEREYNIVCDYYYNNLSFQEISDKHDFCKETARTSMIKAVEKMKKTVLENKLEIEDFYI